MYAAKGSACLSSNQSLKPSPMEIPSEQSSAPQVLIKYVLFCFVLFCFVLFCFVLFCFVLFCFVSFRFVLFCFRKHKITKCNIGWKDVWAYLPWPRSPRGVVARRVSFLNFLLPLVCSSYNPFVVHQNVL